jgi:SAM-dependent methyltransferase
MDEIRNIHSREFSEQRHIEGAWDTRVAGVTPVLRALWNYISFKRAGASALAKSLKDNELGLETGCGKGAYARWILSVRPVRIVAADWSLTALKEMGHANGIMRVCADACRLPFKPASFDFYYSVDVLGHIEDSSRALDEVLRVTKKEKPFFIHSECCDYQSRWPDRELIKKSGKDSLAEKDGHSGLRTSAQIYKSLSSRFIVNSFFSPAGITGWLTGYPEKYFPAFKSARWLLPAVITAVFLNIKRMPVAGVLLRMFNAAINRAELFFGIVGGGSCFASGTTPQGEDVAQ